MDALLKADAMRRYTFLVCVVMLTLVSVVWASPRSQIDNLGGFALDARADLELLANAALSDGERPEGWTFNVNNVSSPTYVADLWFDHELLADAIFSGERPAGWRGAPTTNNPAVVLGNVRGDLELAADEQFGLNNRPAEWRGAAPIFRCDRTVQNLMRLLREQYQVSFTTTDATVNFCQAIAGEADAQMLRLFFSTPEIETQAPELILTVRGDLERLADERLGVNTRPPNWIGNKVVDSPTLASDLFLDLETLADALLGAGTRPPGWIGVIPTSPIFAYRNLRHDVELLADALAQVPRPRGWQGTDSLASCDATIQNLATILTQIYGFTTASIPASGGYCLEVAAQANQMAENPPVLEAESTGEADDRFVAESQIAFSYLDQAATQYMGAMPFGTKFKAWYRNFGESSMMFVSGDDFAVYIDRRWTTLGDDIYQRLPTTEGVKPLTFCDASWCNGPGPTPTATGSGAIQALLDAGTPPAPPESGAESGDKRQVSWNNIRVSYLLDNAQTRTAQVTLEICTDTTQIECEPVTSIFDNGLNVAKQVLSQFNGLNVYEFPYGYTANLLIESATLFSPDVWISDPTIR
jgi:hypothetical protein